MPFAFCSPPVCWLVTYNYAAARVRVVDNNFTPPKVTRVPLAMFPAEVAALQAKLNAMANMSCDTDCLCVRLHKNAVTVMYDPQSMGPHPTLPGVELYMQGITATGFWGMCLPKKGSIRIKKGDEWVYPEDLPSSDILPKQPSSPSPGGSSHKKKKGKKGKTKRRR